jgi:hypothetical protein
MPDTSTETSAKTSSFRESPAVPDGLISFRDYSRPIVPPSWRSAFLGERWIAGKPCAVQRAICSTALLVDVSFSARFCDFAARYCYDDAADALLALRDWDGRFDPPGHWTKEVVTGRMGPGAFENYLS